MREGRLRLRVIEKKTTEYDDVMGMKEERGGKVVGLYV